MIESKKKNNKTILIIILLVIATILGIILCILHALSTLENDNIVLEKNNTKQVDVESNPKDYTIEEILSSFGCKNISYSVESDSDNNRFYKINLKFMHNLYENEVSQEEYFKKIVNTLKTKLSIAFNLIDEIRDIDIYVDPKNDIFTINGIEDYFNNNSYIKVNSHVTTHGVNSFRSSSELNKIINNNWSRYNLKLEEEPISIDTEWIEFSDFKYNYTDININYIIFLKSYDSGILSGIKVGSPFSEIQETLGKPMFKNSNKMIGYKTSEAYVFFYKDEVVVYPFIGYTNVELEKLIIDYYNKNYDGYRTNFVMEILNDYVDFKSEIMEDGVKLYSYTRGIELYLYDDNTTNIVIYDNYNLGIELKRLAEVNKVELNYESDAVYLYEVARYSN